MRTLTRVEYAAVRYYFSRRRGAQHADVSDDVYSPFFGVDDLSEGRTTTS
jgi:hypothetical protein